MKRLLLFIVLLLIFFFNSGCDDSEYNNPPALTISADKTIGGCPLTVSFTAVGIDEEDQVLTYRWDFGDGSQASYLQNPSHTYRMVGVYYALCRVTDNGVPSKSAVKSIEITAEIGMPELISLSPSEKAQHMPEFTLAAEGSYFAGDAVIFFNSIEKETTFISSEELRCSISPDEIRLASLMDGGTDYIDITSTSEIPVFVRNYGTYAGDSNILEFTVHENHEFSEPSMITLNVSDYPAISVSNQDREIYTVSYKSDILFSRSIDNGKTWTDKIIAECNPPKSRGLGSVIRTGNTGTIYVAWSDLSDEDTEKAQVVIIKSEDKGETWTDRNTPFIALTECGIYPSLVVDSTGIPHMAWLDRLISNYYPRIMYSHSIYGGKNWIEPEDLWHIFLAYPSRPSLVISKDDQLHISCAVCHHFWTPFKDIFYTRKEDSWIKKKNVSNSIIGNVSCPSLSCDNAGNLNLLWLDGTSVSSKYIYYSRSADNGETWSIPIQVTSNPSKILEISSGTDSAGNINVVYVVDYYLYYSRSVDSGETWTEPIKITDISGVIGPHCMDLDDEGNIHIVWRDSVSPANLYYSVNSY